MIPLRPESGLHRIGLLHNRRTHSQNKTLLPRSVCNFHLEGPLIVPVQRINSTYVSITRFLTHNHEARANIIHQPEVVPLFPRHLTGSAEGGIEPKEEKRNEMDEDNR